MMNDLNVEINNFGPIHNANIKIGKINVVTGYNATGKSTISKLLYCIFKATSEKRQDFAYESMMPRINSITAKLEDKQHFLFDYDKKTFREIIEDYKNAKNEYIIQFIDRDDFNNAYYLKDIQTMDHILNVINKNGFELYKSILRSLIQSEFSMNNIQGNFKIKGSFNNEYVNYISDFTNNRFLSEGNINFYDVYYIDSISLIDIFNSRRHNINNYFYTHDEYLKKLLQTNNIDILDVFDNDINTKSIKIENKLKDLIKGEIKFERGKFMYYSNSGSYPLKNISLSIKQMGIIQMLLSNRELKENSLLIIDEPELHLHPRLQDQFAAILVMLACCLNVVIYINTYSNTFLDSLSYYQAYYNFKGTMNFYLTEPADEIGRFNLKKVEFRELLDFMSL